MVETVAILAALAFSGAGVVLAALLFGAASRGPLLEVVHGHPGSEVVDDTVRLVAPGRLRATLAPTVDLVLALAAALAGRSGSRSG